MRVEFTVDPERLSGSLGHTLGGAGWVREQNNICETILGRGDCRRGGIDGAPRSEIRKLEHHTEKMWRGALITDAPLSPYERKRGASTRTTRATLVYQEPVVIV